ncbi:MAG: hypothetical protein VX528_01785, partial [Candidatus Latescibacterota bacterium]|nr:hypothetical protein [Candidatus Latescibacterota bacterium]
LRLLISLVLLLSTLGVGCLSLGFALLGDLCLTFFGTGLSRFTILANLSLLLALAGDGLSALNLLRCSTYF